MDENRRLILCEVLYEMYGFQPPTVKLNRKKLASIVKRPNLGTISCQLEVH